MKNKVGRKRKEPKWKGMNSTLHKMALEGIRDGPEDNIWAWILPIPEDSLLSQTKTLSQDDRNKFEEVYQQAKEAWHCVVCDTYENSKMLSGYIECEGN